MRRREPQPSRALVALLERIVPRAAARAAVGDILEELSERAAAGRAPRRPSLWLNLQVLAAAAAATRIAVPRLTRSFGHTARDAVRTLRRSPAYAAFILLVLGVAIAAATVTFSVVDAVVLRPLPFERPDQVVQIAARNVRGPYPLRTEEFRPLHDGVPALEHVAAFMRMFDTVPVTVDGTAEPSIVMHCSTELFDVLRLAPAVGRIWSSEEESHGDRHLAVIAYRFWQRRFRGDASVIGRTLQVENETYQIVGVLPRGADAMQTIGWREDVWVPLSLNRVPDGWSSAFIGALGRLRDGATPVRAETEMKSAVAPLAAANPPAYAGWQPQITPMADALASRVSGWMLLALGAVGLVMLIGCANAANVMLARSLDRARELALRASLGASRRQLAASLLVESLLLSLAAVACALLFATWGVGAAKASLPAGIFRVDTIALNGRVLTASIAAALATGLLFGMAPAWLASRVSIVTLLKDAGATATAARRGWRSALLIAQIACISVLLVVCALFITSFVRVIRIDLGIERANLLAVSTRMPFKTTVDDVQSRLKQQPGVVDVAVMTSGSPPVISPAFGGAYGTAMLHPAGPNASDASVEALVYRVTPNYFDVTGMRFRRGSGWTEAAALDPAPVVLDERAAHALFADRDPLGLPVKTRLYDRRANAERDVTFTVVGVVPFVYSRGPEAPPQAAMYLPIVSRPTTFAALFARTAGPAAPLAPTIDRALSPVAPAGETSIVHAVDDAVRVLTATRRYTAALMTLFALFALLIGAAGIYGVMASIVSQRTREIGVRVALGASSGDIRRGVLGEVGRMVALGLAAGLPAGWWLSRGFNSLFFQVGPADLSIYVIVALVLVVVALIGAFAPARRACRVDPVVALRAS
jgi:predicted permease